MHIKKSFLLVFNLFFITISYAQNNGILPLTGLRYFTEGISAKAMEVKLAGSLLLSNRLPLNSEIEICLLQPTGFKETADKTVFAAAELVLISAKGETLSRVSNIFSNNEIKGFAAKDFKTLSIRFSINAEMMKANLKGTVKVKLYDLKGSNQLRLEMPITIARPGEPLQVSKTAKTLLAKDGFTGMINGLKVKNMQVSVDTTINVSPKMAYTSLDISTIEGSSIAGIFQGNENFWVYDDALNEIKITDILLKQVKGVMENNTVNYTLKIPYRPKASQAKVYTVRFRWESPDKMQLIDVVVRI